MLNTTQTIYLQTPFFDQEARSSAEVMELDRLFKKNPTLRSNVMDSETKQQIVQSLLLRIRQMSRIRRLSAAKLNG